MEVEAPPLVHDMTHGLGILLIPVLHFPIFGAHTQTHTLALTNTQTKWHTHTHTHTHTYTETHTHAH